MLAFRFCKYLHASSRDLQQAGHMTAADQAARNVKIPLADRAVHSVICGRPDRHQLLDMRAKYPGASLADLDDPVRNPGSGSRITEVQVLETRDRLGSMDM